MSWYEADEVVEAGPTSPISTPQKLPAPATATAAPLPSWWEADEVVSQPPQPPAEPKPQRTTLGGIGRQVGLTARHALEGAAQAAEIVTEPARQLITDPIARAIMSPPTTSDLITGKEAPQGRPLGQLANSLANSLGLPTPENTTERVVSDAARFMAGGAGIAGASRKVAQSMTPVAQQALGPGVAQVSKGPLQSAAEVMGANPGTQIAGSAGTGLGSGMVREEGGGVGSQVAGGLVGGFGVAGLVQAARGAVQKGSILLPIRSRNIEQQINQTLGRAGVNWEDVPDGIRRSLRTEVDEAMRTGQPLDADALARLVDFKRVGAIPTRGTVSLDPVQITREQNLARSGANSSDTGLQGLSRIQNDNNRTLIENLNQLGAGAVDDAYSAGSRSISALQRGIDNEKAGIDALYQQARDSAGRSFPLDGQTFTASASKLLDDNLLGGALPPSVQTQLNRIAQGEVPFTVDYAEQLKTAMGKLQRASSDGQTRMAIGMVRQALDETPVLGLGRQGPAAGARTTGTTIPATNGVEIGEQAMLAFDRARTANREMMRRVERIPGLKDVYDGKATPDDFIQKNVISPSAKLLQVGRLANELKNADPQAFEAVRSTIAQHLKTSSIGASMDDAARFNAGGFNRAMRALGERKLQQFFSPEEVDQLKAIGRVATYTTTQPAGSAVNNSNSGALLMGRGMDLLDRLSAKLPLLGIGPTVSGITRSVQQSQAQNVAKSLVKRPAGKDAQLPSITFGSLMAGTADD